LSRILGNGFFIGGFLILVCYYDYLSKIDNGIPIFPFYDSKDDTVLLELAEYLKKIEAYKDLREANKKYLKLKKFQ
jgi:hypothetical protein